jgi:hypothetical protein
VRALTLIVVLAAIVAGGCAALPDPAGEAPQLVHNPTATGSVFFVRPWPFDASAAFLCLRDPGEPFTGGGRPAPESGCVPLDLTVGDDQLQARFDIGDVPVELLPAFQASSAPWYLAIAGSRGSTSQALVMTLQASPIASQLGPS